MPSKMKKAHKSIANDASLDRKEEHVSPDIKGKLDKKESGKKKENLDKKDKHVSSGRLGSSTSRGEGDCNAKTLSEINRTCESGKSSGSHDRKEEHVSLKNEGEANLKALSKRKKLSEKKKQRKYIMENQILGNKDEHGSLENDDRICNKKSNEGDPDLKMPSKAKKTHKYFVPLSSQKLAQKMRFSQAYKVTDRPFHNQCGTTPIISPWVGGAATTYETIPFYNQFAMTPPAISPWVRAATTYETIPFHNQCGINPPIIRPWVGSATTCETIPFYNQCGITPIISHSIGTATTHETIPFHNQCRITPTFSHQVGVATTYTTYKPTTKKKIQESGKRTENLQKKDKHVSSENNCGLGNSGSGGEGDCNLKTISNRKKRCESGKSNGSLDRREEHVSSNNEGRLSNSMDQDHAWINPKKSVGCGTPGRCVGKLFVSNTEIAKGSSGTIFLEGSYEHRSVAVKRIARAHYHIASQEIQSLSASDGDPNIIRLYGAEQDQDFVYLALERCACSLDDLIRAHSKSSGKSIFPLDPASNAIVDYKMHLGSVKGMMRDVNLWREDGHPSPLLLKLMRGVVSGLVHLHRSGIIHQDLKPQNILITKELCAKLSDMGISRLLPGDTSSSEYHVTGARSMKRFFLLILIHKVGQESTAKILREVKENGLPSPDGGIFVALDTQHLYKNQLQTFAQKRSLALPIYCSEHEGPPQARRFRCKVSIDGRTYETLEFYNTLKEAEHAAARIALMSLPSGTFHEVDCGLYKSLLQEITKKQGHCLPVYETVRCDENHLPIFVSTVKIEGESFTGKEARTKKMAETSAAKVAYTILKERTSDRAVAAATLEPRSSLHLRLIHAGLNLLDCGGSKASEQLCPTQQTSSVDVFGLGCVLFFCITGGRHPFGDSLKGDSNIKENTMDLSPVEFMPEAEDLFARLLNRDPNLRPKALEVLHHPLFWDSKTRLSFLRDISDWVKSKAWGTNSDALEKLESIAQRVFDKEWKEMIDCEFMKHARKFRAYEFKRVEDLLRIVRNTFSHYRELPPEIQEIVGSSPEDLDSYFTKRFPRLLIETYRFVSMSCKDGEPSPFPEYFDS